MQWLLSYPFWILMLVAVLAAAFSYLLYRKSAGKFQVALPWIVLMASLRWAALFLVGLLLLNPLLKHTVTEEKEPEILVLEDNSSSIRHGFSPAELNVYQAERNKVHQQLSRDFQTKYYAFGAIAKPVAAEDTLSFDEKRTDINAALKAVMEASTGKHIGAIVISSDGLFNTGTNPVYNTAIQGIPVYTVALGDTSTRKDLLIRQARYNDLVYLGDELSVLVDLAAYKTEPGEVTVTLKNASGTILQQQNARMNSEEWSHTVEFRIKAENAGVNRYMVSVTQLKGELTYDNNKTDIVVNVIDGRQKVLVLYDAPHPDVRFLREVLSANKNIEPVVSRIGEWNDNARNIDLLILHGLPGVKNRGQNAKLEQAVKDAKAVWFITSTATDLLAINKLQDLVAFELSNKTPNEVFPKYDPAYQKFSLSTPAVDWLNEVTPLVAPYGKYLLSADAEVCWTQNIGKVSTGQPLLVTGGTGKKYALLAGEGIWRWAMQEMLRYDHQSWTMEWVDRLVQYIAVKTDQRPFRLRSGKDVYHETETITLDAALYNESFQLINQPDVQLVITGDGGFRSEYVMDKTVNAYSLNLGTLPSGSYTVQAGTVMNGKSFKAQTKFTVQDVSLEALQTKADHALMRTLAINQGGKMFSPRDMSGLVQALKDDERIRPLLIATESTEPLINLKWLFAVILLLLAAEWFMRRFLGQY